MARSKVEDVFFYGPRPQGAGDDGEFFYLGVAGKGAKWLKRGVIDPYEDLGLPYHLRGTEATALAGFLNLVNMALMAMEIP